MSKRIAALLVALLFAPCASATQLTFSYSKLYAQLKHNQGVDHPAVKVGYFMVSPNTGEVCRITKAWMTKKDNYEAISVPESQELLLPIDRHLKKVNPDVFIVTDGDIPCDISYQVMTTDTFSQGISHQQLVDILPQMNAMMADLGGMLSSWFMPEVKGVTVHFSQPVNHLTTNTGNIIDVKNKMAILHPDILSKNERVLFTSPPVKITPWIPRD